MTFVDPRPEDWDSFFLLLNHDSFAYEDRIVVSEKRKMKLVVTERDQFVSITPQKTATLEMQQQQESLGYNEEKLHLGLRNCQCR